MADARRGALSPVYRRPDGTNLLGRATKLKDTTMIDDTQKPDESDMHLMTAGQTVEYLSRLLGAALHKLGGSLVVGNAELRQLDGMQIEHGQDKDSGAYVVRLSRGLTDAELERQALEARPS